MLEVTQEDYLTTEKILAQIRRKIDLPLPDQSLLDTSPLSLIYDKEIWDNFLNSENFPLARHNPELQGKTVVFDLDETLLMNSFISPEIWELGEGYRDQNIKPAFQYQKLSKTIKGRIQTFRGHIPYDTCSNEKYPFLKQPRHIVMFRPGILFGLKWLQQQNVKLILATASARRRVDFLAQKFPIIREIFEDRIITANDIAYYYLQNLPRSENFESIFKQKPYSLAAKVPDIFKSSLSIELVDLLVDDSETTKKLFKGTSLENYLLSIDSDKAVSGYGLEIIIHSVTKLLINIGLNINPDNQKTIKYEDYVKLQQIVRAEDPYYWPLCHTSDQLPIDRKTSESN